MAIPNRVRDRMIAGLKSMSPVVSQQKTRDVSEADTVTLVKDLLASVFGYDKYSDLTGEVAIRGTFCDLAIKDENKITHIVEVKAVGISLDDRHVKQAVDYAANQGVEWVLLTNAVTWRLYHVIFAKPIDKRLIIEMNLLEMEGKKDADLETLYLFSKEGFAKGAHIELRDRQDASSRYMLAALVLHNIPVRNTIRRELRRVVGVLVDDHVIQTVMINEVIKRDAVEGPAAASAAKAVAKRDPKANRSQAKKGAEGAEAKPAPALVACPEPSAEVQESTRSPNAS